MATARTVPSLPNVAEVRRFNRFYTRQIGVLQEGLLSSPFSLTEVRVLYEIAHHNDVTAVELCRELGLDAGYLSRILRSFEKRGLIARTRSEADARQSHLSLTPKGHKVFQPLETRSNEQVAAMLEKVSPGQQKQLVDAMHTIESAIDPAQTRNGHPAYVLRTHRPGDMGWIVHRHGELYWKEYRYDERFEALVAEIGAEFIQHFDARRERCWIAEKDGEIVGSISSLRSRRRSPSCACCWSSPRPVASASAAGSWRNVFASPARRATRR